MYSDKYHPYNNMCMKEYDNMNNASKPYRALNTIVQKSEIPNKNENINKNVPPSEAPSQVKETPTTTPPVNQEKTPTKNKPTNEEKTVLENKGELKTGYIAVGVFTALQALPVPDAVVTIYLFNSDGEEEALYILVTDANGRIPDVELPVSYNPNNPLVSSEYYFTSYNIRVQAINYYTVNILDVRVFPDITTVYRINMIPVIAGTPKEKSEQTIVIPPSPIDKSNE